MSVNYYSIQSPIVDEIEIRKSRFITYLYPIQDEEEFQEHLAEIKKEHYRATHHCQAFILNADHSIQRANDDGEPSGTAGLPMLEVLKHHDLTFIMAITVRYYGGIKLGAGGLIRAYGGAVSEALEKATIIQNVTQTMIDLTLDYPQVDVFNYFLEQTDFPITLLDTEYTDRVTFKLAIHETDVEAVQEALIERFSGNIEWENIGEQTVDIPINK